MRKPSILPRKHQPSLNKTLRTLSPPPRDTGKKSSADIKRDIRSGSIDISILKTDIYPHHARTLKPKCPQNLSILKTCHDTSLGAISRKDHSSINPKRIFKQKKNSTPQILSSKKTSSRSDIQKISLSTTAKQLINSQVAQSQLRAGARDPPFLGTSTPAPAVPANSQSPVRSVTEGATGGPAGRS